jgi:hypothetical protein
MRISDEYWAVDIRVINKQVVGIEVLTAGAEMWHGVVR